MNSIGELSVLRGDLVLALDMQRYHELLDVDDKVRAQVQSAMEYANSTRCSAMDKQAIKIELSFKTKSINSSAFINAGNFAQTNSPAAFLS